MPRILRIERENGAYHVINRGNSRQDLFINEGAHQSFEKCLFEACEKCGWILEGLRDYRWSSYWYLMHPASRPGFLDPTGALTAAGKLSDTPQGRRSHENYLKWLNEDNAARKEMAFNKMCRGWALGSKDFKRQLLQSEGFLKEETFERLHMEGRDLAEANELIWENTLKRGIKAAAKTDADIANDRNPQRGRFGLPRSSNATQALQALGSHRN
jgi:hypothetical protein